MRADDRERGTVTTMNAPKPPHPDTVRRQQAVHAELDFSDEDDFADADRGFVATLPDGAVFGADGRTVYSQAPYAFLEERAAPLTVNPSLWRLARLNRRHGLYRVSERIFQVRGLDLANLTFIEGDTGTLVIDCGTVVESARAAWALYRAHRPARPIRAVIYSHSHTDHYGGVRGLVDDAEVDRGDVAVIAPAGFMEAAVSENLLAGVPMRRRAAFQFGGPLPPGPASHVDSGLGRAGAGGRGTVSLIAPTWTIAGARERHVIDGVEIVFQLTPNAEAPAEMNFFLPGEKALNLAENACQVMHNLCPLRGARTRDALAWSKYLGEALEEFAPHCDVALAQHHWPVWGRERILRYLSEQRDLYRYLHDQTLRLMSHGRTPREIADELMMPRGLARRWHTRGYYGAVAHNVRAVYAHYMGPYDGNPFTLDPLPPVEAGRRYVDFMGGADALLARARADFGRGEFRWVVEVLQHLVFADPGHREARELAADAMEQLGYQAESATWRNSYLLGARELRAGSPKSPHLAPIVAPEVVGAVPLDLFLDVLAIRVNGPKAQDLALRMDWTLADDGARRRATLVNGVLNHVAGSHGDAAQVRVTVSRAQLAAAAREGLSLADAHARRLLEVDGDLDAFAAFLAVLDDFRSQFAVVEP